MGLQQIPSKGGIPSGNTAGRPGSPVIGDTYYNGTLEIIEIYNGTNWVALSAPPAVPSITSVTDVGNVAFASGGTFSVVLAPGAGGSTPTQYNVATVAGGFTASNATSPVSITGLTVNTSFEVVANAQNNFGTTVNTTAFAPVLATTLPQAPTISGSPVNTGAGGEVTVPFTAGNNGGKAITNYKYSTDGTTYTALSPAQTTSPLTISGLTNGTSYTFRLKAVNGNGDSLQSNQSSSITPSIQASVQYVIVAGGGGGGGGENNPAGDGGGGGGAGGLITGTAAFDLGTYSIQIGGGGTAGAASSSNSFGGAGSLSRIHQSGTTYSGLTVPGGGGGGGDDGHGQDGGCGGGASGDSATVGVGSPGFNGGARHSGTRSGGGGGGMGSVGSTNSGGGNGGAGVTEAIKSIALCGGGSGAGGTNNTSSGSTTAGGGNNAPGTANKGGGGGAGRSGNIPGYAGGSGVIILKTLTQATSTTGSPVSTTSGSYYIYEFQSAGTITW